MYSCICTKWFSILSSFFHPPQFFNHFPRVRVRNCASGTVPINTFREHLTCFPNVKSFTFFTLELVYQVGGFAVGKGGDGISEAGVGAGERLGGDVVGTCLAAGTVAGKGSTGSGRKINLLQ